MRDGVHGKPLYDIDGCGRLSVNVVYESFEGGSNIRSLKIEDDVKLIARLRLHENDVSVDVFHNGKEYFFDHEYADNASSVMGLLRTVDKEKCLSVFAAMLHSARDQDIAALLTHHPAYDTEHYRLRPRAEIDDTVTFDETERNSLICPGWRYHDGRLLSRGNYPFLSVLAHGGPDAPVEITANVWPNPDYGIVQGAFRLDQYDEAVQYAHQLVELGFGNEVKSQCSIEIVAAAPPMFINHYYAFASVSKILARNIWGVFGDAHKLKSHFDNSEHAFREGIGSYLFEDELDLVSIATAGPFSTWADGSKEIEAYEIDFEKPVPPHLSEMFNLRRAMDCLIFGSDRSCDFPSSRMAREIDDFLNRGGRTVKRLIMSSTRQNGERPAASTD